MSGTKCPFVVQKGKMNGEPAGVCTFDKKYGHMCPLLNDDTINDNDVECFNLTESLYTRIAKYKR